MSGKNDYPADKAVPGSDRSAKDVGLDGASVKTNPDGSKHVTSYDDSGRYSYDVDPSGKYVPGSTHYTDNKGAIKKTSGGKPW
jgi:hypothetical protein